MGYSVGWSAKEPIDEKIVLSKKRRENLRIVVLSENNRLKVVETWWKDEVFSWPKEDTYFLEKIVHPGLKPLLWNGPLYKEANYLGVIFDQKKFWHKFFENLMFKRL